MPNEVTRYFIGDVYACDVAFGFLVRDCRGGTAEPTIDEETVRAIVSAAGGNSNAVLTSARFFELSQKEFDLFRDDEIPLTGLPKGLTLWLVR